MKSLLTLLLILTASALRADQSDQQLQVLFDQLKMAPSQEVASQVESSIWQIWRQHEDAITNEKMALGISAMNNGQVIIALNVFNNLVTTQPDFAEGWNKRATLNYMVNKLEQSKADIKQTLRLEPRHFGALSGLGLIYLKQKDYLKALEAFEAVLVIYPQSSSSKNNIEAIQKLVMENAI